MVRSSGGSNRCRQFLGLLCRKSSIEINTAFIHFSIICMESGFIRLEKLESLVRPHSVDFTAKGHHHNTLADYTYGWYRDLHRIFA